MKWQNLTNRIIGIILVALVLANIRPIGQLFAQESSQPALLLKKCWETESEDAVTSITASDNESHSILTRAGGKVDLIETKTGKRIWRTDFGGEIVSSPVADAKSVFILTNSSGENGKSSTTTLRAISLVTGVALWTVSLPYFENRYLKDLGEALFALSPEGSILVYKKSDGSLVSRSETGAKLSGAPRVNGNEILLPLQSSEIVSISAPGWTINIRIKTAQIPSAVLRVDERTLIWGNNKGTISAIESSSGTTKWRFRNGGAISGILGTKAGTLVTSYDNFAYLLTPGGRVIWKRRLAGRVVAEPIAADAFAMVTILGEAGVSFIDLENGKILNKIIDGDENGVIGPAKIGNSIVFASSDRLFSYSSAECSTK